MTHPFELRQELTLHATPEQVWQAIATGPGVDAWFMGRTELGAEVGGPADLTMLGHTEHATITAYEPNERLATRSETAADGRFMAFEYLIEAQKGGTTVLRMVHSGMLGDDWETEFEALKVGSAIYSATLAEYLRYFPSLAPSSIVTAVLPDAADPETAWKVITTALSTNGNPSVGDPVLLPTGQPGEVFYSNLPVNLGVRTPDGLYRFIHSGADRGNAVVLGHQLFTPRDEQLTWDTWLTDLFGPHPA
ncbi:SRPBCC domain-containing protein [Actinocorallia lasiicapitis]